VPPKIDYLALARATPREQFVVAHPFLFLFGQAAPLREAGQEGGGDFDEATSAGGPSAPPEEGTASILVLPICKTVATFPSMISVGRTANNDLVIPDPHVSRMHAYFQQDGEHLVLIDAGSQHGTSVDGQRLGPNRPVRVGPDQLVRFAQRELVVLNAHALWERVRRVGTPAPRGSAGG